MISVAADPDHPEHQEMREWLGVEFDPAGADPIAEVTERCAPIPTFRRPDGSYTNW